MKILIAYSTVTGTAREAAELLAKALAGQDVRLADLGHESPDPSGFDVVAVGGAVRFGKISKHLKKYLGKYRAALSAGNTVYFVCCGLADRIDEYFEDFLSAEQRRNALSLSNFGGTLKVERQKNPITKAFVRAMRNDIAQNGDSDDESAARVIPELIPEEISRTADLIRKVKTTD